MRMKKLSDFTGEEAIDLWADLLDSITAILGDKEIANLFRAKEPIVNIAKKILKLHKKEAVEIMTRIDPTPVDGLNAITRIVEIINEVSKSEELKGFFSNAGQGKTVSASFGSVTANTEDAEI